jgi:hypothetical protein
MDIFHAEETNILRNETAMYSWYRSHLIADEYEHTNASLTVKHTAYEEAHLTALIYSVEIALVWVAT